MTNRYGELPQGPFAKYAIAGGLPKLLRIWEHLRKLNTGGYGSGRLVDLPGLPRSKDATITSCSPFTATAIMMALDPREGDLSREEDFAAAWNPRFGAILPGDGTQPLTRAFYDLHNTMKPAAFQNAKHAWKKSFKSGYVDPLKTVNVDIDDPKSKSSFFITVDDAAGSIVAHNIGCRVDAKQMRRGDLVAIEWNPRGCHATFCWNVHLDANGEVDAFQAISSNGRHETKKNAEGKSISVGVGPGISLCATSHPELDHGSGGYSPKKPMFVDAIADPRAYPEYVAKPYMWFALPDKDPKKHPVDPATFGIDAKKVLIIYKDSEFQMRVKDLRVARLFGITPPDPYLGAKLSPAKAPVPDAKASGTAAAEVDPAVIEVEPPPVPEAPPPPGITLLYFVTNFVAQGGKAVLRAFGTLGTFQVGLFANDKLLYEAEIDVGSHGGTVELPVPRHVPEKTALVARVVADGTTTAAPCYVTA